MTREQLLAVKRIISHGNCPDGISSALIALHAYRTLGLEVALHWYVHGTPEAASLEPGPGDLFLDCSPRPELAQKFIDVGALCLDHHTKGSSCLQFVAAGQGVFGDEQTDPGVSGVTLTYQYVWLGLLKDTVFYSTIASVDEEAVTRLAELGGIRDTWQSSHPKWVQACELAMALRFWPFEELQKLSPRQWASKFELGVALWSKHCKTVGKIIEGAYSWTSPKGTRVLFFQGALKSSDVAEFAGDTADLIIGYDLNYIQEDGGKLKMIFSTRSHSGFDCGAFALAHGGGGHTPAAGFNVIYDLDGPNPYTKMKQVVTAYEGQ